MFTNFLLRVIQARYIVFSLAAVWAIAGVWIACHTPIDALPDISENQVLVYAPWPNHNPPEIYAQVSRPLADALQAIPGLVSIRGSSDVGFSSLYLIFDPSIEYAKARELVSARLANTAVVLPEGVKYELAPEGIPTGQFVWYTLSGKETDLLELRSYQDSFVAPRLRKLPGVAEVSSVGGFEPEIRVELDSRSLAAHRMSLADVLRPVRDQWGKFHETIATNSNSTAQLSDAVAALEDCPIRLPHGAETRIGDVSRISLQPAPRYGVFERDGTELVGGVVHLQAGRNPLQVTRAVLAELESIGDLLPSGYRLTPCYDRIGLITGAVSTVTRTLIEALLVTTICIVFIMRHFRTSLVITLTLPLAILGAFLGMQVLRYAGLNLHANIMSLAGIAISIGVLVDASVVIVENVTFSLKREWEDRSVTGNTDLLVARATALVARPAVLATTIMLVSFLPVFALGGIDGQLIRPLAWTKSLTLLCVIVLTVTLVPALCSVLIRGRLRSEDDSRFVRGVIRVYKPILTVVCQGSWVFALLLSSLMVFAAAATGSDLILRIALVATIACVCFVVVHWFARLGLAILLVVLALSAQSLMRPIGMALRLPLDEGMIMDMPITLPRMTVPQAADDLKARNMLICRFPEIHMVTGKAGRAETAFDPAPIDMIESMVEFRPTYKWPKRRMLHADARQHAAHIVRQMIELKLIEAPASESHLLDAIVESGLKRFDAIQRETCWHLLQSFEQELSNVLTERVADYFFTRLQRHRQTGILHSKVELRASVEKLDNQDRIQLARQLDANSLHVVVRELSRIIKSNPNKKLEVDEPSPVMAVADEKSLLHDLQSKAHASWKDFVRSENQVLYLRAGATWTQIVVDELCARQAIIDDDFQQTREQVLAARFASARSDTVSHTSQHIGLSSHSAMPIIDPNAVYEALVRDSVKRFDRSVWLWTHDLSSLTGPDGELDGAVQMPGWANVWTRPIQNRIDMLATGVSSEVGVRVLGDDFDTVVATSERIAKILQEIPGAASVIADPIRGKGYVNVEMQKERVSQMRLNYAEVDVALQAATTGYLLQPVLASGGQYRVPIRLTILPPTNSTSDTLLDMSLALRSTVIPEQSKDNDASVELVGLRQVAKVRHFDGPASIKSTGGQLCNYVRLNVRGRKATAWVREAKEVLKMASLPPAISIEWTGQFEHAARTRNNLLWMIPLCVLLIILLLLLAFQDIADAMLMLMSIPGALAGGALAQWILGYPYSVSVGVGYLACFGMAAATSMVMIIYLRRALSDAGGLQQLATLDELRECIILGAVHRIRPKLLTEATMVLSLAPLLWSTGVGADIIRPMAAPVLGGILVADEIVDLLIPALFFAVRRRRWLRNHALTSR